MKPHIFLFIFYTLFTFSPTASSGQKFPSVQIIHDSIKSSFRGLSVPSDEVIWVSGSNGTVGRSTDAGKTWRWMTVPGFEKRDFRDIEAFDSLTAIIMAVDNPGNILKTTDGGENWKVVFHKEQEGMFLDAMDFKGSYGYCVGDPIVTPDGRKSFYYLSALLHGDEWTERFYPPAALPNEAIFAASGTSIFAINSIGVESVFVTGGDTSRLIFFHRNRKIVWEIAIPIIHRKSAGAFSICGDGKNKFYIAGGDYIEYWKNSGNVVYTTNAGKTWKRSSAHGYRSCIIQTGKKTFITCGTNGVDISFDGCKTFRLIHGDGGKGKDGFNVCAKSKTGKAVYFAGSGRIGKLIP